MYCSLCLVMCHAMNMEGGVEVWIIIPELGALWRLVVSVKPRRPAPHFCYVIGGAQSLGQSTRTLITRTTELSVFLLNKYLDPHNCAFRNRRNYAG
jgi:hypothetical protein